jgi:hypothetical protein
MRARARGAWRKASRSRGLSASAELHLSRPEGSERDSSQGELVEHGGAADQGREGQDGGVDRRRFAWPLELEAADMALQAGEVRDPEGRVEMNLVAFGGGKIEHRVEAVADPELESIRARAAAEARPARDCVLPASPNRL